jgi:predicted RNA-binding protein with PUA-like domain
VAPARAARGHWLVKSEPGTYSWQDLVKDGRTRWDGVRNAQARNNLRAMQVGERALFYHSGESREIVGVAEVVRSAYRDPTTEDERWLAVDIAPLTALREPVSLATVKADASLRTLPLVTQSRLSVMPIEPRAFARILKLAKTALSD